MLAVGRTTPADSRVFLITPARGQVRPAQVSQRSHSSPGSHLSESFINTLNQQINVLMLCNIYHDVVTLLLIFHSFNKRESRTFKRKFQMKDRKVEADALSLKTKRNDLEFIFFNFKLFQLIIIFFSEDGANKHSLHSFQARLD